ncbi:glycosyltransferase family 39 protein [Demequina pelophila]|uniref:glycosyltransferase family 39 protein n=1 Tax=Demequina pelophila TaxID=1638984 RepID=UPI000780761F|nr:glycosyltransferase family 39 protein [Demequina pelophila]
MPEPTRTRVPPPAEWLGRAEEWAAGFRDSRASRWWVTLLYVVVSAVIVIPVVTGPGTALSRIDEPTHADYAYQVAHGTVPYAGSVIAPEIRDLWACAGQERYELPACGDDAEAWEFPYQGQQYNYPHPPLYYAVVGVPARAIAAVTGTDFITAARLLGIGWLAGGMLMLFVALRRWRIDPAAAIIAPLLLPAFPRVLHAVTTVNPDAAAILIGASALWLAARILVDDDAPWWLGALLAGAAGISKTITTVPFIALGALMTFRALRDWRRRGRPRGRDVAMIAGMAGAILLPYLAWSAFQSGHGDPHWVNPLVGLNTRDVVGLPGSEWMETLFSGLELASDYYVQPPLNVALLVSWTRLLNVLIIGAIFAVIVACAKEPARRSLGWLVLAGTALFPTIVQIQAYFNTAVPQYFPHVTGRYGLALIPAAVACIVVAAHKAGYRRLVYVLSAGGLVVLAVVIGNGVLVS